MSTRGLFKGFQAIALVFTAVFSLAAQAAETPDNNPAYRIGPEDVLQVSVWKEEGLDKEVLVRPDGGMSFPLAGDMTVSGKTPKQVQEEIRRRIQRYIPEAVVTVAVNKVSGYSVFVIGQVKSPGQFTLGRYVDVMQALTLAGGMTPYASEADVKIQRRNPLTGEQNVYRFNYRDVKRGRGLDQNIVLHSGDVVVVP